MPIQTSPNLPAATDAEVADLTRVLTRILSDNGTALFRLASGYAAARLNATDTAPTHTGAVGDIVPKLTITEAGAASSMYVVTGWIYDDAGVWQEMRALTGN